MRKYLSLLCIAHLYTAGIFAEELSPKEKLIEERIKPVGQVTVGIAPIVAPVGVGANKERTGDIIYNTYCHTCHATGISGAPRAGNKVDWQPRLALGVDKLTEHAIHGLNAMPAKGLCMDCTDQEIKTTVEYMVKQIQ